MLSEQKIREIQDKAREVNPNELVVLFSADILGLCIMAIDDIERIKAEEEFWNGSVAGCV